MSSRQRLPMTTSSTLQVLLVVCCFLGDGESSESGASFVTIPEKEYTIKPRDVVWIECETSKADYLKFRCNGKPMDRQVDTYKYKDGDGNRVIWGTLTLVHNQVRDYYSKEGGSGTYRCECVAVYKDTKTMKTTAEDIGYVMLSSSCEPGWTMNRATGRCYQYRKEKGKTPYGPAHKDCKDLGGQLASASDQAELDFVRNLIKGDTAFNDNSGWNGIWLGATNLANAGFKWADGSDVTWGNWYPGKPNRRSDGVLCLVMRGDTGQWSDASCTNWWWYRHVCMKNP